MVKTTQSGISKYLTNNDIQNIHSVMLIGSSDSASNSRKFTIKRLAFIQLMICFLTISTLNTNGKASEEPANGFVVLTDETYDQLVVDPSTDKVIGDKPWLLFFYKDYCGFCKQVKPVL